MLKSEPKIIPRIDHICLTIKDMSVSAPFYKELYVEYLGGEVINEDQKFLAIKFQNDLRYFLLELSQEDERFADSEFNRYRVGLHHFAIELENKEAVDKVFAKLTSMNCKILDKPAFYPEYEEGYYAVYFQDPNGFKMEFMSYS